MTKFIVINIHSNTYRCFLYYYAVNCFIFRELSAPQTATAKNSPHTNGHIRSSCLPSIDSDSYTLYTYTYQSCAEHKKRPPKTDQSELSKIQMYFSL